MAEILVSGHHLRALNAIMRGRKHTDDAFDDEAIKTITKAKQHDQIRIVAGVEDVFCDLCSKHDTKRYDSCRQSRKSATNLDWFNWADRFGIRVYNSTIGQVYTPQELLRNLRRYGAFRELVYIIGVTVESIKRCHRSVIQELNKDSK